MATTDEALQATKVAGAFEDHYTSRYKKHSPSVKAFEPDAATQFEAGEVVPSDDPAEVMGMDTRHQETMSRFRMLKNKTALDYSRERNAQFIADRQDKAARGVPVRAEDNLKGDRVTPPITDGKSRSTRRREQRELKIAPEKELLKQALAEQERTREIIDPDNIPDGSYWNVIGATTVTDVSRRAMFEVSEAAWEAMENTARTVAIAATNVAEELMPNVGGDYYHAWVSMLNDNEVRTQHLMRPSVFPDIKNQEHWGYGLVRGMTQFMTDFLFISHQLKKIPQLTRAYKTRGIAAGIPADFLAFDPAEGNLHTFMQSIGEVEIGGEKINLDNAYTKYMASDLQDTQLEGRLRNTLEGAIIGLLSETVMEGFVRGYGWATKKEVASKLSRSMIEGGKAIKKSRDLMADSLQRRAEETITGMQKRWAERKPSPTPGGPRAQRGAIGDDGKPVIKPAGEEVKRLPAPQKKGPEPLKEQEAERMLEAFSELAVARIVKGDIPISKPEKWAQEVGANMASPVKGQGKEILRKAWDYAVDFVRNGGQNPFWYSKLERSVLNNYISTQPMTGKQILDNLLPGLNKKGKPVRPRWQYRSRLKQGNAQPIDTPVNPQEIKFSGLEAWLTVNKDRPIPKSELVDFIRGTRLQVRIKELSDTAPASYDSSPVQAEIDAITPQQLEEFIENDIEFDGPEEIDTDAIWDEINESDLDYRWEHIHNSPDVNYRSVVDDWADEIEAAAANVEGEDGLKLQLYAYFMRNIDPDQSAHGISYDFDHGELQKGIEYLEEVGVDTNVAIRLATEVKDDMIENYGSNENMLMSMADGDLEGYVNEPYTIQDAARAVVENEEFKSRVRELENAQDRKRWYLSEDNEYFVQQDGIDYDIYVNGRYDSYTRDLNRSLSTLRAYAVRDGKLDSIIEPQNTDDTIVRKRFKGSSYNEYVFANIDQYAIDDRYAVYAFEWVNPSGKIRSIETLLNDARMRLADDGMRDEDIDALMAEIGILGKANTPESWDSHYREDEWAHVRATYRRPKDGSDPAMHIEEAQSDYLQSFGKFQGPVIRANEVRALADTQQKLYDNVTGSLETVKVDAIAFIDKEIMKLKAGENSILADGKFYERVDTLRRQREHSNLTNYARDVTEWIEQYRAAAVSDTPVPQEKYIREQKSNLTRHLADLRNYFFRASTGPQDVRTSASLATIAEVMGIRGAHNLAVKADLLREINNEYQNATKRVNPTPFDDKNFFKHVASAMIKLAVDKGYKRLSWSRPWSEAGSRSTTVYAWREVEVDPYIGEDGKEYTTAFAVDTTSRHGGGELYHESDLNIMSLKALEKLNTSTFDAHGTGNYGLMRNVSDMLTDATREKVEAGLGNSEERQRYAVAMKMFDSRKGYDTKRDWDAGGSEKEWYEHENVAFPELNGYMTNYGVKLAKELASAVQEFDPSIKVNKGKNALLYAREDFGTRGGVYAEKGRVMENQKTRSLGEAEGVAANPYYGKSMDELAKQWNWSEEFLELSGGRLLEHAQTLTKMKYLPLYDGKIPDGAAAIYYVPAVPYRAAFNNKRAAEKIIREFNTYDVEWLDLSPLFKEVDGRTVKRTDGGVSALGLTPLGAVPAYMMMEGEGDQERTASERTAD